MKEKRFGSLIIRHRRSAVFFEREADLENTEMYEPYLQWGYGKETIRGQAIAHYKRCELDKRFDLPKEERKSFYEYLLQIGNEAWANFEPKVADSMRADYDSYWDKDLQDEGTLSFGKNDFLIFTAPYQPARKDGIVRLYKFDKRKFESFLFDLATAI